jgi:glucokinase
MSEIASQASARTVGVEVSKTSLVAVCLDAERQLVGSFSAENRQCQGAEAIQCIAEFINEAKTRFGAFDKIGVAVPGLLHRQTKRVAYSTNIPEHEAVDLPSELKRATGLDIFFENDANAAAYGEFILGAGRGARDVFYVTLGAGIGGALVFGGKIWRGASGYAGEFGHIAVNSEGMRLEDVASSANIVRRTRSRFYQDSTSVLSDLSEEQITLSAVVDAARRHDDFARLMLERTGVYVGTAIASVINLLNVERIVIGGEIMQAEDLVLDAIVKRAKELSFAPSFADVKIVAGELGANAAAIGAALLSDR